MNNPFSNIKGYSENFEKFGNRDIIDLYVYDEEGNRVAVLDSLKYSNFREGKGCMYLEVGDALLNIPFFKFAQREDGNVEESLNQPQRELKFDELFTQVENPFIHIPVKIHGDYKEGYSKKMSLVALTTFRNLDGLDKQVFYKIPNASFIGFNGFESRAYGETSGETIPIVYKFQIDYTEKGTFYDLIIEK